MSKNTGDGELDSFGNKKFKKDWDELDHILSARHYKRKAEVKTAIKKYAAQEANKAKRQLLQELMKELPDREKLVDDLRYSEEFRQWYEGFNKCRTQVKSLIQNKLEGLS